MVEALEKLQSQEKKYLDVLQLIYKIEEID